MPPTDKIETLRWVGGTDGHLVLIDQTQLPLEFVERECRDVDSVWESIKTLRVRGAPAIGIAAAYGVVLGLQPLEIDASREEIQCRFDQVVAYLSESRPTAVNLFWALDRMRACAHAAENQPLDQLRQRLLAEAIAIHDEDREACRQIGQFGAPLLAEGGVLTHCNAGALATAEYGTALSVVVAAHQASKKVHVFVDETRPLLQGARLTAWELMQQGVETTLICDSMAAQVMKEGRVQTVITGADRIAANGDAANKIGTYGLAVLAKAHGIPFYIAAPVSTFDLSIPDGASIPIEQREAREVTHGFGRQTAPENVQVYNPAFDVTPATLITAIVTEHGVIQPVTAEAIERIVNR